MNVTITPPANLALDAAQLQRADDLDARGGYFLKALIGGNWITMGEWYCARDAMSRADGAPSWIKVAPFTWLSVCGKWVVRK